MHTPVRVVHVRVWACRADHDRPDIASAYLISRPSQVHKAIDHLTTALQIAPNDPEVRFSRPIVCRPLT